jgi:hypothetical protein
MSVGPDERMKSLSSSAQSAIRLGQRGGLCGGPGVPPRGRGGSLRAECSAGKPALGNKGLKNNPARQESDSQETKVVKSRSFAVASIRWRTRARRARVLPGLPHPIRIRRSVTPPVRKRQPSYGQRTSTCLQPLRRRARERHPTEAGSPGAGRAMRAPRSKPARVRRSYVLMSSVTGGADPGTVSFSGAGRARAPGSSLAGARAAATAPAIE